MQNKLGELTRKKWHILAISIIGKLSVADKVCVEKKFAPYSRLFIIYNVQDLLKFSPAGLFEPHLLTKSKMHMYNFFSIKFLANKKAMTF